MDKNRVLQFIEKYRAVAVIRLPDPSVYDEVEEALVSGGVKIIEITMTTPDALTLIERASNRAGNDSLIGVGSVTDAESVNRAADAGARFIVSPVVKSSVIKAAVQRNIVVIPGAFTPSEIQHSHDLGADMVKVFPAGVLGPSFLKAVLAPMPGMKLMPTGGVTPENIEDWLKAGAASVGLGSSLVDDKSIQQGDFASIRKRAQTITDIINRISG